MFDEFGLEASSSYERFAAAQKAEDGRPLTYVTVGEARIFENGAKVWMPQSMLGNGSLPKYRQPPFTAEEQVRYRLEFVNAKIADERKMFDHYQSAYMEQARNHVRGPMFCPPPPDYAIDELKAGSRRIALLLLEESELKRKLVDEFPDSVEAQNARFKQEAAEEEQRRVAAMTEYRDTIASISRG